MTSASSPQTLPQSSSSETPASGQTATPTSARNTLRLRPPRSLPPWIDSYDQRLGSATDDQFRLLSEPAPSVQPQHNATPTELQRRVSRDGFVYADAMLEESRDSRAPIPHFLRYGRGSKRGRKWDHLRTADPVIVPGYAPTFAQHPGMEWNEFLHSSAWAHMPNEESEVVDADVFRKLQPTFDQPVEVPLNPMDYKKSRRRRTLAFSKRLWNLVIRHTLAPLIFRLIVLIASTLALGIACRVFELADAANRNSAERTQSIVAIVVDSMAIPYTGYMIWDEYTGKPLGLRSGVSKISLILLDLFFIIFKSASTSLAFQSLVYHSVRGSLVRNYASALAAFMLIGLIAWTMNFTVNIFRTVERLGGRDDNGMG